MKYKHKYLSITALLYSASSLCFSANSFADSTSTDIGLGYSLSNMSNPVSTDFDDIDLSTQGHSLQLSYNMEDWLFGASYSVANNSVTNNGDSASENNSQITASFDQIGYEFYSSYFVDNWTLSIAIGNNELDYETNITRAFPNPQNPVLNEVHLTSQNYTNQFLDVSVGYWLDLSKLTDDLSLSVDIGVTQYESEIYQSNAVIINQLRDSSILDDFLNDRGVDIGTQEETEITTTPSESIITISASLDHIFLVSDKAVFSSVWVSQEWSDEESSVINFSRSQDGRINNQTFDGDNVFESSDATVTYLSFGVNSELLLTDNFSVSAGYSKTQDYDGQWQLGMFYQF